MAERISLSPVTEAEQILHQGRAADAPAASDAPGRRPHARAPRPADREDTPAGREPLWRHALGDQLRGRRRERGETLAETADRAGISLQYLSEMERGVKEPSSEMIAAVAGALDTTLADLTTAVARRLTANRSTTAPANNRPGPTCRAALALAA